MFSIFSEDRVARSGLILFKGISILYILDFPSDNELLGVRIS